MSILLSCLKNPVISTIEWIADVLPSIEKIYAISYNSELKKTVFVVLYPSQTELQKHSIEVVSAQNSLHFIENRRKTPGINGWYSASYVDLEIQHPQEQQLNIYDEASNRVLQLSFQNSYDKKFDIIYIFFRDHKNKISIGKKGMFLSGQEKPLIEEFIKNMIQAKLSLEAQNRLAFQDIQDAFQGILHEKEMLQRKWQMAKEKLGQTYIELAENILKRISETQQLDMSFEFTEDAKEKLLSFKGTTQHLERVVQKAFNIAANIFFSNKDKLIHINAQYLNFQQENAIRTDKLKNTGISENDAETFQKTIEVLNRYEAAAEEVIAANEKLTITKLGHVCKPFAITAAAVSDSIKNHQHHMNELFEKYPDKWPIIKSNLKPIRNKIITKQLSKYKSQTA